MTLSDFITKGIESAGGVIALAEKIGVGRTNIPNAKAGERGLPNVACVKLAKLIDADPLAVIAASELVTEKDEKKRAEWLSLETWRARDDSNVRPLPSEGSTLSS